MYLLAYDRDAGLVVALSYGELTWADHVLSMETLDKLDRDGASGPQPLVTVLVIEPDAGTPTPQMRQDYAAAQGRMRAPKHLFLLVTTSKVVRGVITAVNWLRRPTASFHTEAFATFEQAAHYAEKERGTPLPKLSALLAEVERQRATRTRTALGR